MNQITLHEDGTATFKYHGKGMISQDTYNGMFKVKCILSPLEYVKSDRFNRELLGDNFHLANSHAKSIAFALSQLQFRIIEFPPFWENREVGGGHIEENIIQEVMELAIEAEEKYRTQRKKEAEDLERVLTNHIKNKQIVQEDEVKSVDEQETEIDLDEK